MKTESHRTSVNREDIPLMPANALSINRGEVCTCDVPRATLSLLKELSSDKQLDYNDSSETKIDKRLIFKAVMVSLGILSGVPWITPAMDAAVFIRSPDVLREIIAYAFGIGIVYTVGADGAYVMHDVSTYFDKKPYAEHFERIVKNPIPRALVIGIFSTLACTSPVYATVTYSGGGFSRFLSIISAFVAFGYGVYGYQRLANKIGDKFNELTSTEKSNCIQSCKENMSLILQQIAKNPNQLENVIRELEMDPTGKNTNLLSQVNIEYSRLAKIAKKALQLIGCTTIPPATALVTILLAKSAMQLIWDQPEFYITMTILAELPSYVLNSVSTYYVFGGLFDTLYSSFIDRKQSDFLSQTYPKITKTVAYSSLIFALTAPSAAAYITYTTIGKFSDIESIGDDTSISPSELENEFVTWGSVAAISLARYILSVFTQQRMATTFLFAWASRSDDSELAHNATISRTANTTLADISELKPIIELTDSDSDDEDIGNSDGGSFQNTSVFSNLMNLRGIFNFSNPSNEHQYLTDESFEDTSCSCTLQ